MRILITNDDGVDAPGIAVMSEIAAALSDDVWVVAPDGNQSGAGHRFTLGRELTIQQRGRNRFTIIGGSPADCVVAGMTHILEDHPADLVLSGVNAGQNLGDIIHCSGTAAGAREGALQGAIGIAMSQAIDYEKDHAVDWSNSTRYGAAAVEAILGSKGDEDVFYNVNFPTCSPNAVRGIAAVPHQRFSRSAFRHRPSQTDGGFFVTIPETPQPLDPASDFEILRRHNTITVTPIALRQSEANAIARLSRMRLSPDRQS